MNSLQNTDPSDLSNQSEKMLKRPCRQHESFIDKAYRFRGLLLVILIPVILISLIIFLVPRFLSNSFEEYTLTNPTDFHINRYDHSFPASLRSSSRKYAVIFDAGSSGSRVHVFCFNGKLDLVPIGNDLELFIQIKPGLSAYAADPQKAAESLVYLLESAENVIPPELRANTPVRVGATAGLRTLEGDRADRILQAVRDLLKKNSSLKSNPEWVSVLDGAQEGSFQWVTINFLLGNIGNKFSDTVGVVDLGGGSVQMAYAISETNAAKAPRPSVGEDSYVKEMYLKGVKYHLYVHSYLHYGLLAARAEILKAYKGSDNPCVLSGYHGTYKYGGQTYDASASPSGSSMEECREVAIKALNVNGSTCTHMKCTFGGVWNGGGGDGQRNLFVASFFFDRASEAGFVNSTSNVAKVRPADFKDAAKRACGASFEDAGALYPSIEVDNLPYLCMDLVYQFTLLVDGFALNPWQVITLVKRVEYRNFAVEAAWPLGSAIEAASF